ncbi:hypothetical protein B6A09_1115 [Saccharomyces cerevisiae synthetic construct]|uniref:Putative uncharacterized protein YBR103C-A n=2 Tax=Saccharomyces cerevisiae TaxID=4932 RepID=YB103_YEAST|nr:RecName: Full=Putative uncharacterized protein YBR103C-A [Saccharomyces cerevisiae S288C]ARB01898.1 hypothetical protein B6A09_1115 [Saccharomyces cerevisiae synthetic construct]EWG87683.1 hypothetical protein R008_B11531 [Saccharomyces cerevisiae R008]EWG92459.1 hypothetical protein P301_B11521 [Saccharomyces cerevisiae P301]EWG97541.1 hypothetical protein R103_B40541 [Saccharomyces cerevisiae R103]KZV13180.1 hypothetical protein WN66_00368 [Saccharomyces cerevisiae]CBK39176.1 EC1118_1B15
MTLRDSCTTSLKGGPRRFPLRNFSLFTFCKQRNNNKNDKIHLFMYCT